MLRKYVVTSISFRKGDCVNLSKHRLVSFNSSLFKKHMTYTIFGKSYSLLLLHHGARRTNILITERFGNTSL